MFRLLSIDGLGVAQSRAQCENQRMVDKPINVSAKLDEIKRASGFETDAQLAECVGVKGQNINNWRKRKNGWTSDAMKRVPATTGASLDWMNDLSAVAFPNGVKVKLAAPIAKRVERAEGDIDQARKAMLAFLTAIEEAIPGRGVAAAFLQALEGVAPSESYAEKGFHALLASGVKSVAELAAAAQPAVPQRAAHQQAAKKRAR